MLGSTELRSLTLPQYNPKAPPTPPNQEPEIVTRLDEAYDYKNPIAIIAPYLAAGDRDAHVKAMPTDVGVAIGQWLYGMGYRGPLEPGTPTADPDPKKNDISTTLIWEHLQQGAPGTTQGTLGQPQVSVSAEVTADQVSGNGWQVNMPNGWMLMTREEHSRVVRLLAGIELAGDAAFFFPPKDYGSQFHDAIQQGDKHRNIFEVNVADHSLFDPIPQALVIAVQNDPKFSANMNAVLARTPLNGVKGQVTKYEWLIIHGY